MVLSPALGDAEGFLRRGLETEADDMVTVWEWGVGLNDTGVQLYCRR